MKEPELHTHEENGFNVSTPKDKLSFTVGGKKKKLWLDKYVLTPEAIEDVSNRLPPEQTPYTNTVSHVHVMRNDAGVHAVDLYFKTERARNMFRTQTKRLVGENEGETESSSTGGDEPLHTLRITLPPSNNQIVADLLNIVKVGGTHVSLQ